MSDWMKKIGVWFHLIFPNAFRASFIVSFYENWLFIENNNVTWYELVWPCAMCTICDWPAYFNKMRQSIVIRWTSTNWFIKLSVSLPFRNSESHCYLACHILSCWLINNHHIWLNHDDGTFFEQKFTGLGIWRTAQGLYIECDKYSSTNKYALQLRMSSRFFD